MFRTHVLVFAVLLPAALSGQPVTWSGDLTLTVKGSGVIERPHPKWGKISVTWNVDRLAKGRVVLDKMYTGTVFAGTPNRNDPGRYESWIAQRAGPLDEFRVEDVGTYLGPVPGGDALALDDIHHRCPGTAKPIRPDFAGFGSSALQIDYLSGTYTWEVPRLTAWCDLSHLRTPKKGSASFLQRTPWELLGATWDTFDVSGNLFPREAWYRLTGAFRKDDTEIVLSRKIEMNWGHPLDVNAPVTLDLVLVLRKNR